MTQGKWFIVAAMAAALSTVGGTAADDFPSNPRPALPLPPGMGPPPWQSQCGDSIDLLDVQAFPPKGPFGVTKKYILFHSPSTVQLQWLSEAEMNSKAPDLKPGNVAGERWCTGTLIDDRHVLTAAHCLEVQKEEQKSGWFTPWKSVGGVAQYAPPATLAKLQWVNFGYEVDVQTGNAVESHKVPIETLIEFGPDRAGGLDYAIVRLAIADSEAFPSVRPAKINLSQLQKNDRAVIIQHPQGKPKKVGVGTIMGFPDTALAYDNIDTFGGASGSGIRDKDGQIVGVHTNGGCSASPDGWNYNRGVSIIAISSASDLF